MNRHALGLRFPILIAAGCIAMDDAQAADTNEKETVNAVTLEALDDHLTRLESTIAGIVYTALFDPCLASAAINMEWNRAPDGSGNVFILKNAGRLGEDSSGRGCQRRPLLLGLRAVGRGIPDRREVTPHRDRSRPRGVA